MTTSRLIAAVSVIVLALLATGSWASTDAIKAEVERQLAESSPWAGADLEIADVQLSASAVDERFDEVRVALPDGMRNLGKVTASVTLLKNGKESKRLWASARIKVYKNAVVALSPIKMGKKIEREDLKTVRVEIKDSNEAPESADEVAGMLAKRPIAAGAVIKREYLKGEAIVKKGERVSVILESSAIRLKSIATAAEDGPRGGIIAVKTPSGKEVTGRVTGPGEITVSF